MMPRMWSLTSDYSIPQLKYSTTPKIVLPTVDKPKLSSKHEEPSNKPNDSNIQVKKGSQASFTNLEKIEILSDGTPIPKSVVKQI